jgi:hypothetical protein
LSHHWRRIIAEAKNITLEEMAMLKSNILTIIAALQLDSPLDETIRIGQILEKYSVGTERPKIAPPPPTDASQLGPLRYQDLRSVHKRAHDILHRSNNRTNVRAQEDPNNNTIHLPKTTTETYHLVTKMIVALHKVLKDSNIDDLDAYMGYRILAARAAPITFSYKGNVVRFVKDIKRLIELANNEYRTLPDRTKQKRKKTTNENDINQNNENNSNSDDLPSLVDENQPYSIQNDNTPIQKVTSKPKCRYTCCACNVTSTNTPTALFTLVPYSEQRPLRKRDNNNVRKEYYKRIAKRKYTLKRLGLQKKNQRKNLRYCDRHQQEMAFVKFSWKNKDKETKYTSDFMRLPIDPTEPPNRTRSQARVRNDVTVKNNRHRKVEGIKQQKKSVSRKICNFKNCKTNGSMGIGFHRIPPPPTLRAETQKNPLRNVDIMHYECKQDFRLECLKICGICKDDNRKELRICKRHVIEEKIKEVEYFNRKQQLESVYVTMYLPTHEVNTTLSLSQQPAATSTKRTESRGLGRERMIC